MFEKQKEKKKMESTLTELKNKRDLSVSFREKSGWNDRLKRAWNYYYFGVSYDLSEKVNKKNERKANYVYSNIEAMVPKIFDRFPSFTVRAGGEDDEQKAPIAEAVLKYKVNQLDVEGVMEDVVRDQLISSLGLLKVTWGYQDKNVKDKESKEETIIIEKDDVEVKVINPENFFIYAGDRRFSDTEGVFEKMYVAVRDAKRKWGKDHNFEATYSTSELSPEDKVKFGDVAGKCVIWEFHGICNGEKKVWTFTDDEILDVRDWYEHGRLPYVEFPNIRGAHEFYPWSEIYQLEPLQDELIEIDTQASEFRKRCINPKKIVKQGSLDAVNMARLRNPKINVIEAINPQGIQWEQAAMIGQDLYNFRNIKKEDISLITGQNEQSRGGIEETVKTATGQQIMSDAAQGRIRHKVRIMSRGFKELLRQIHGLLMQFQDKEEVVKITDKQGFQKYTKEDIAGDFDFEIDIVESMPYLREKRGQLALQAYELFKDDKDFDQKELKKKVAKLAFQDINAEDLIVTEEQRPPQEQPQEQPQETPEMQQLPNEMPQEMPVQEGQPAL